MNTIDIIVLAILVFSCINGLRRGLLSALASLLGWIFALIVATCLASTFAPFMSGFSHNLMVQKVAAFACVALAVIVVTWLLTSLLSGVLKTLKLDPLNRLAGALFGTLKSLFIVLIVMQSLAPWLHTAQSWKHSLFVQALLPYAPLATEFSKNVASDAIKHMNHQDQAEVATSDDSSSEQGTPLRSSSEHLTKNPFN
ncbi:CvpA family protein [Acinetobacter sp. ANC 4641]|uniref:CvpA family protein n=1 Tax=Acinetobacter sp. ANC 4641 TaxID=2529847 RepID=UPI0010390499|nr:CvpA family protein [Acinetobacter sp. ANC 4641]TCB12417.1 CvpA family protein [Acinetobacter sp. ANC 4641]